MATLGKDPKTLQFTEPEPKSTVSRLIERFKQLDEIIVSDNWRGLIIYGPPGIGKTYNIVEYLKKHKQSHIYKDGRLTPQMLVEQLWQTRGKGWVLVLDDVDKVFGYDESTAVLKGCLDSTPTRFVRYNVENHYLMARQIPQEFEYHGRVIMLTNYDFTKGRASRLLSEKEAIESRCRRLNMTIADATEIMEWTEWTILNTKMLDNLITEAQQAELLEYMWKNVDNFRVVEQGLRAAKKCAEFMVDFPNEWKDYVEQSMFKGT